MKMFLFSVFFIFVEFTNAQEINYLSKNLSNIDYEVLNSFFSQVETYHYVDTILRQNKYNNKFESLFKANLNLFNKAHYYCANETKIEKLKFYCPLADALKKYDNLFENDVFHFLRDNYNENGVIRKIDLSKILNPKIINQSYDYYKSLSAQSYFTNEVHRYSTIRILGIYYLKDEQIALIAFENISAEVRKEVNFHLLSKKKGVWWKSLGTLRRL